MILLDINVISEWMRPNPNPKVLRWLDVQAADNLYIPSIVKAEIEYGIAILADGRRKAQLLQSARIILDAFENNCLALDCAAAGQYARILADSKLGGRAISVEDAQIAAIAVSRNFTLATRNTRDFEQVSGLQLSNPWD